MLPSIPPCPNCGNSTPEKISQRDIVQGAFLRPVAGNTKQTVCVYRCSCGTSFTHSIDRDDHPPGNPTGR